MNNMIIGLLLLSAVAIMVCVLFGEYFISQEKDRIIYDKESRILPAVARFQTQIFDTISLLEITASQPSVMSMPYSDQINDAIHGIGVGEDNEKRDVAKRVLYVKNDLDAVFFTLPNGDIYLIEPYPLQVNVATSNFAFREWYQGVINTKTTYVGEVYVPLGRNDAAIAIATPVRTDSGEMVGILGVLIDLDSWAKVFGEIVIQKNEAFFIIDHNGNLVINSNDKSFKTVKSYSYLKNFGAKYSELPEVAVGVMDGVKMFIMSKHFEVGSHLWTILIVEPYDDIFSIVNLIRIQYVLIVAAIVGTAALCFTRILNMSARKGLLSLIDVEQSKVEFKSERGMSKSIIINRKNLIVASISCIVLTSIIVIFMFIPSLELLGNIESSEDKSLATSFVIQNLKGDTLDTWIKWNVQEGDLFHVHISQTSQLTSHQMEIIRNAIFSTEVVQIDDSVLHKGPKGSNSTYYKGWKGAIESISEKTKFVIPLHFHSVVTETDSGDVVIRLSNLKNSDGYYGYTKSFVDDEGSQILKATITIYDVENLNDDQLDLLVRHEFGHALGLAHSTAPEDLMAPIIDPSNPYISQCDIDALEGLYNGDTNSHIVCEK
jgi:hypothetical protein